MQRVLVVEDDPVVAEVASLYLARAGYEVEAVADGPAALDAAARRRPDLVVLDLLLPSLGGLEVYRRLRAAGPLPVIVLTALAEPEDRVLGLEAGVDDYLAKPFSPRELVLRVQSVLRRAEPAPAGEVLTAGGLTVDVAARVVRRDGQVLTLPARELDLLVHLLRHPGRAFSRPQLLEQVWGWTVGDPSTVTVHVRRLREKIEDDPGAPRLLVTVWGTGYRLDLPAAR